MNRDVLIKAEGVSKKFSSKLKTSMKYGIIDIARDFIGAPSHSDTLRPDEFWGVQDVSFEVRRGESLGLIGPNGAGKSTLLKMLNGIILPDKGSIEINGRVGALIEVGAGFHPLLTGRENIYINGSIMGLSRKEIDQKFVSIVEFAELGDFIDTPVSYYSSGMYVRLGFAIAAYLNPQILLVDEVLAVGDMAFQRKCLHHFMNYLKNGGVLIFVSHNMHLIQSFCNNCLLLDQGQVRFKGPSTEGVNIYFETQNLYGSEVMGRHNLELNKDNPVVIEKVDICPINGNEIRTGESVQVILHYCSIRDFDDVTWNFSIWTGDQWVRITTGRAKFSNNEYRLMKGKGRFYCTIPNISLVPGTYALKAEISDLRINYGIARIGWENAPVFFTVKGLGTEVDNRRVTDGDLVLIDIRWGND
jgi:lipopolysaccharide transport system ATP-binding protein